MFKSLFNNGSTGELNDTFSAPETEIEDSTVGAKVTDVWMNNFETDHSGTSSFTYSMNSSENYEPDMMNAFINLDLVLICFYIPVFLLSVTANTLVIVVVIKYHYMRNVTNLFLVNLSVADLLVTLLCIPVQIGKAVTLIWFYGEPMCKTVYYLQGVSVAASVFTITSMAVDRYLAITQSVRIPKVPNRKSALIIIILVWVISLALFAPMLWVVVISEESIPAMNSTLNEEMTIEFCMEDWTMSPKKRRFFGIFSFILVYAVPGFIIILAYSLMGRRLCSVQPPFDDNEGNASTQQSVRLVRERKRVAWILLLLAVLFAVCWLPYNTIQLLVDTECISQKSVSWILPYALLLGHTNSAINPIVYCFMTKNFRRSVKKLLYRTPEDLSTRKHQRCRIRWTARAATPSSEYDSCDSLQRKNNLQKMMMTEHTCHTDVQFEEDKCSYTIDNFRAADLPQAAM